VLKWHNLYARIAQGSCEMRHTVGVADMKATADPGDIIVTHALGSCLGITVHDPVANVGGMVHVMLPDSGIDTDRARQNPYTFVDTGVPLLFRECYKYGAMKERLRVYVAGGACKDSENDFFQIGKRNLLMLRKLLWKNGVLISAEDVGGVAPRTMSLEIGTGAVVVKITGEEVELGSAFPPGPGDNNVAECVGSGR